jgi:hypothetical protein
LEGKEKKNPTASGVVKEKINCKYFYEQAELYAAAVICQEFQKTVFQKKYKDEVAMKQNRIRSGEQQGTKIQNQIQTTPNNKKISKPEINPESPKENASTQKVAPSSCLKK